nr:polysaccharide biosynthesis/export family protein [Granulicella sp. dw_53]
MPLSHLFPHVRVGLAIVGLFALACVSAIAQQGFGAPKVGGTSSFDTAPILSGNNGTSGRRPLSSVSAVPEDFANLKLSPGFLLNMEVYDAPEFSADLRINVDGNVNVPMVGAIHVSGETLTGAASLISQRLQSAKILNNPQVNLNITQYAGMSVSVLGEVHNPGRMELLAPHNLADVIALAGGETQYAGNTIEIRHATPSLRQDIIRYSRDKNDTIQTNSLVLPGDTVTVRRAGIVYVLGSVNRPGGYIMQEGGELDLTQALSLAYGTSTQAAVGSMKLIRKLPDGKVKEIDVPYRSIVKGKVPSPRLQAEDVIYVPVSKIKSILTAGLVATAANAAVYRGY